MRGSGLDDVTDLQEGIREVAPEDNALAARFPSSDCVTCSEAVVPGGEDAVARLLQQRADPNGCGNCAMTPLSEASYHGHERITRLLIAAGAGVNKRNGNGEDTALEDTAPSHLCAGTGLVLSRICART